MEEEKYTNMESQQDSGLSFGDLLFLIKKNFILIIVITIFCTIIGGIYGFLVKKTTYTATATAIVMAKSNTSNQNGYQDYLYSNYLIDTFQDFMVSDSVVDLTREYLEDEGYKLSNKNITDCVTISSKSLMIRIKVVTIDSDLSIKMANGLLEKTIQAANVEVNNKYKYDVLAEKLAEIDYATETVAKRGASIIIIVCFLVGLVISFGIVLVKYLLDDTFTSKDKFEKTLKLNVLALLQTAQEEGEK